MEGYHIIRIIGLVSILNIVVINGLSHTVRGPYGRVPKPMSFSRGTPCGAIEGPPKERSGERESSLVGRLSTLRSLLIESDRLQQCCKTMNGDDQIHAALEYLEPVCCAPLDEEQQQHQLCARINFGFFGPLVGNWTTFAITPCADAPAESDERRSAREQE